LTQAGCRVRPSADGLPWCRASGFALRTARVAVSRGLSPRKPERSEARGGDASQQPGKLDCLHLLPQAPHRLFRQQQSRPFLTRRSAAKTVGPSIPPQAGKRHALSATHPIAFPSSFHPQQHPLPRVDPARDRPLQLLLCASGADPQAFCIHTLASRGYFGRSLDREVTPKYCGFVCVFSGTATGNSNPGGVAAPKDVRNRGCPYAHPR